MEERGTKECKSLKKEQNVMGRFWADLAFTLWSSQQLQFCVQDMPPTPCHGRRSSEGPTPPGPSTGNCQFLGKGDTFL